MGAVEVGGALIEADALDLDTLVALAFVMELTFLRILHARPLLPEPTTLEETRTETDTFHFIACVEDPRATSAAGITPTTTCRRGGGGN